MVRSSRYIPLNLTKSQFLSYVKPSFLLHMTICIVGTVVIGAAGLIIDNRLDKEEGIGYDHHGNEIAHNWTGGLVLLWWTLCGIGGLFLSAFPH